MPETAKMARTSSILMFSLISLALAEAAPHYRHVIPDDAQDQVKVSTWKYNQIIVCVIDVSLRV